MYNSEIKVLMTFPPPASPVSSYLSALLLAGQLKGSGYNVKILDLSLDFFNYVLNKDYLKNTYEKAKNDYYKFNEKYKDIVDELFIHVFLCS